MFSNYILGLILAALTFTASPSEPTFIVETTGIGIGRPTAACDGMGVCIVTSSISDRLGSDNFGLAKLTIGKSGTVSQMRIDGASMTKYTIKKYFSGDRFLMPEPFEGMIEGGKNGLKIYIPSGKHRLKMDKGDYIIMIGE